jgi:N4-gp56 family major capsid protein
MTLRYNAPPGSPSSLGVQLTNFYYQKKALIEVVKEQYFSQLADVTSMPKNMGKQIKRYLYLPLLSDENLNDQGIDAAGVTIVGTQYYVSFPSPLIVANGNKAALVAAINDNINNNGVAETIAGTAGSDNSGGTGFALIPMAKNVVKFLSLAKTTTITNLNVGATVQQGSGNLYGSTKDIGLIDGKMPVLSESGGRVNKVGFKRKELTGSLEKFGFFDEYTQESMDFDSDEMLEEHINREMLRGANEMTEDALQIDLLNSAGIVKYCGSATSNITTGETSLVTYTDLMRLGIDLDNNRTPKKTTVITGTRLVDTKTIPAARVAFIGSELKPTLKAMKDLHNNPAFIEVQKYAAGGTVLNGEIGAVDEFRFVVVPEMMKWAGAGADASASVTSYETNQRYDVFPILVVGDESFTTIGFQTDGKSVKFKITHKKPGEATADRTDPYGETGFMSIKWYYGFMVLRPERIAVIRTVARL